MTRIYRFGVSLEKELINKFDKLIKEKNYTNRSEAIRDLIRQELVKREWKAGQKVAGAIVLVYDHHKRELVNKLINIQHDYQDLIISTQHIHLDHDNCLEVIVVKGSSKKVRKLSDLMKSSKGVKYVELDMATTGCDLN